MPLNLFHFFSLEDPYVTYRSNIMFHYAICLSLPNLLLISALNRHGKICLFESGYFNFLILLVFRMMGGFWVLWKVPG